MPDPATLAVFALAAVLLIAVPGPNAIYIVTRSVSDGRRAGVASALGVETGTFLHVLAAAAGLSALVASSAVAFGVVKYAGAAYLIYLGIRTLLARGDAPDVEVPRVSLSRAFRQGMLVQLLNPKVALFFLALLPQFVDPARGAVPGQILVLGAILAAIGLAFDVVYALAAGTAGGWLRRRPRAVARVTGGVYVVLGAAAALGGGARRTP